MIFLFDVSKTYRINCSWKLNTVKIGYTNCSTIKGTVQLRKLKKYWLMTAYVFQKYPENFTFELFIILQ